MVTTGKGPLDKRYGFVRIPAMSLFGAETRDTGEGQSAPTVILFVAACMSMKIGCIMYVRVASMLRGPRFPPPSMKPGGVITPRVPDIVFVLFLN